MDIPYFHHPIIPETGSLLDLPEESARHIVSVLRMSEGESLVLVDGRGTRAQAVITQVGKKRCGVRISSSEMEADKRQPVTLAVAPVKNPGRYEWMLEKIAEIGVRRLIPLQTDRTVHARLRLDRLQAIALSAMLQSKQAWMTEVATPVEISTLLASDLSPHRYIAHCLPQSRSALRAEAMLPEPSILLIGPEGDFTPAEIEAAIAAGFLPVALGNTRLRTETAAVVAAVLMCV